MKYYIAIPTYNGGKLWKAAIENIKKYAPSDVFVQVIDSSSTDETAIDAKNAGFNVLTIPSAEFNHGGTRNLAIEKHINDYDVVVFLTQDAIPQPDFIDNLIAVFENEDVVCAYGRQLPHDDANPLAQHARYFNYPAESHICGKDDIAKMGLRTVFMSNSFSAYRLSVFKELGGFPSNTILCEDMYYTAKAVLAGYKVAYVANAAVKHSHNYTPVEEFKRYFDIGVFHKDEPWIKKEFGGAGGEGGKYIISEFNYMFRNKKPFIPIAFYYNSMKFLGYKLGACYTKIPSKNIKKLSMHKRFWNE